MKEKKASLATSDIPAEWLAEFEAAARRPLELWLRYAFIHTYNCPEKFFPHILGRD
jgi:hypothetical protein